MPPMRMFAASLAALSAALGAALPLPCAGAPFAINVGDARILLDVPAGYADTTFTGSPRLQELAETLTSASNRVLVFAISDGDLRRFTLGDPPDFRRYMLVVTPKGMERERLSVSAFQGLVDNALRGFQPPAEGVEIAKLLDKQAVGQALTLAELRKGTTFVSLLQGTRVQPTKVPGLFGGSEKQNYMLSSSTLMHLRGRAINLAVFTVFESADDLAWVRSVTLKWVEDVQRLNSR